MPQLHWKSTPTMLASHVYNFATREERDEFATTNPQVWWYYSPDDDEDFGYQPVLNWANPGATRWKRGPAWQGAKLVGYAEDDTIEDKPTERRPVVDVVDEEDDRW